MSDVSRRLLLSLLLLVPVPSPGEVILEPAPARDRRIISRWKLAGRPMGAAVGSAGVVYVGLADSQSVVAIDSKQGRILLETVLDREEIASTKELVSVRSNASGTRLFVANGSDESVTILSLPDLAILREIGLEGETIRDALPDPAGRYLYILGRRIHIYDSEGKRELRRLEDVDPMAIAVSSDGALFAVVQQEAFESGPATVVVLFETATFKEILREPLQTDREIRSALFASSDQAFVVLARDWLAEKRLIARPAKALTSGDGKLRMKVDFGDLVSSETICLPEKSGPQIAALGRGPGTLIFAEKRCGSSGSFTAAERRVTSHSLYGISAYALAYDAISNTVFATDPAGYLTLYKAPGPSATPQRQPTRR